MKRPSPSLTELVAVIVNWETPDYTIRAAEALIADGVPEERVVIVDNGSADGSYERIRGSLPDCVLVRFEQNIGYARAANAGAQALQGSTYLMLNNDAFLHSPGSVRRLLAALENPAIGIVVPRLLNVDLTLQRNVVPRNTPGVELVRATGLSRVIPNRWQPRFGTHWDHASPRGIDAATGAVFLFRAEVWHGLGGLPVRNYMYADDLEVCLRARREGWRIWFEPKAEFIHVGNGSCGRHWGSEKRAEMVSRSESAMIREHLPRFSAQLTLALMTGGVAARWLFFALRRDRAAAASLRGTLRGLIGGATG